jgi:hypothetical protein
MAVVSFLQLRAREDMDILADVIDDVTAGQYKWCLPYLPIEGLKNLYQHGGGFLGNSARVSAFWLPFKYTRSIF